MFTISVLCRAALAHRSFSVAAAARAKTIGDMGNRTFDCLQSILLSVTFTVVYAHRYINITAAITIYIFAAAIAITARAGASTGASCVVASATTAVAASALI